MPGTAVGPGAIPVLGINGLHNPPEIQNLTPGISARVATFFRDIALGGCLSGGGEAPRNVNEIQDVNKAVLFFPLHGLSGRKFPLNTSARNRK